ncbi:AEC family transporter [Bartonella sp. B30(2025)]
MINTFFAILPIFLLIVIGYLSKIYIKDISIFWSRSDKFVYYVFFPALLILDISEANFSSDNNIYPIISTITSTLLVSAIIFLMKGLIGKTPELLTSIFQGGVRYNSYVFIALSQSLFGNKGVALSGFFVAYMIIITNIISVLVMNHYGTGNKKSIKGALIALTKNPLIIGAIAGVIMNIFHIHIIEPVKQLLSYLSGAATPLSLMSVGAGLIISMQVHKMVSILWATTLKLLIMPIITIIILKATDTSGVAACIAILYSSVPCAGNAYILSRQMGGDYEVMASIITWTTLFSIITITLIMGSFIP